MGILEVVLVTVIALGQSNIDGKILANGLSQTEAGKEKAGAKVVQEYGQDEIEKEDFVILDMTWAPPVY
ncbi:MAG: hypothetical protein RMM17_00900 [Acidobacteriota bacterium]|nr:hypothetical protein [Blastocatellia bacterium]MDW8411225.1 hypothetical protein [Acidobacteriota bacterium]